MRHRTLMFLWIAAAGFVLSLGRVGRLHPFGVAFFFSCLGLGPAHKAAAALGVVAGAAFATPGPSAVMVLATVAAGWAVALGPPGWLRGRSAGWLAGPAVVAARLAGAGPSWSAPPLWWLETAVEGALAGLLVPLWSSLLGGLAGRGQGPARPAEQAGPLPGGADALAGWLTMVCGVALGLQGLAVGPVQPAAVAAPLGVMFTAWGLGPGLAASAGALAGWAMALADGRWTLYGLA
ncbi:MAG TPA: hypothetical protein VIL11_02680, partial [Limnochordales bacterium]